MNIDNSKIWIHSIWPTANKLPLILSEIEVKAYKIVADEFSNFNCKVELINGTSDHLHILFLMNPMVSITELVRQIQFETAKLINSECFNAGSFNWQSQPLVLSVSESQIPRLLEYIRIQKEIHKSKSFQAELNEFKKLHALI